MSMRLLAFSFALVASVSVADAAESIALPLKKVVFFNAGLGYFEHEARVTGTQTAELKFTDTDVNDLLKSLVLQDLGGGKVHAVSLPSLLPANERLHDFSFDLTSEPTLAELLHQLRGERISLDDGKVAGVILGIELKEQAIGEKSNLRETLNLLTDDGLRSIPMSSVSVFKLQNERVDRELKEALALIATRRETDKKSVRFEFIGQGERVVRVGYIRQVPIWKASYRVVLDKEKSLLQGWAIVENNSEVDWQDIAITLMSGRPVTFEMDLYRPLFVRRQQISPRIPEVLASRLYTPALRGLDFRHQEFEDDANRQIAGARMPGAGTGGAMAGGMMGMGGFGGGGAGFGGGMSGEGTPGSSMASGMAGMPDTESQRLRMKSLQKMTASLEVTATPSEVGEQFQYRIDFPVQLARRQTALIPIVNHVIDAEKISVFTAGRDQHHPMRAAKLVNNTQTKLVQGPATVFDADAYAGDAQIDSLPENEHQFINYALDIELRIRESTAESPPVPLRSTIERNVLVVSSDAKRQRKYRIESRADEDRSLLLELPRQEHWRAAEGVKILESTESHDRFQVSVPAQKTIEFSVPEERTTIARYDLGKEDLAQFDYFMTLPASPDVKSAIKEIADGRRRLAETVTALELDQQSLQGITAEQNRIRQNMATLTPNSELFKNYVVKLTDQETRLDTLRTKIEQHRSQIAELRESLAKKFVRANASEEGDPFK